MRAKELKKGDIIITKRGHTEIIQRVGKGWQDGQLFLEYVSGEWSEVDADDEIISDTQSPAAPQTD